MSGRRARVLCIVTGADRARVRRLTRYLDADITFLDIDRSAPRLASGREVWRSLRSGSWDLVYQEGTGIAGGINLIWASRAWGQRFILSSGDPVGGFFRTTRGYLAGALFARYEKALYHHCAGFVGWTPYLTGMALSMGARRGVTVEGAVDLEVFRPGTDVERAAARQHFGLAPEHLVCGVVGSLNWTARQSYCYGLELIESLKQVRCADVSVIIVGDGSGKERLERSVPDRLRARVVFTGRLRHQEVARALHAMDVGFITQTLDGLGSYRLTTKLPEYLACGLPVAMSPVPGFYDYVVPAGWALPPHHPASPAFHTACAAWLDGLHVNEVREKAARARDAACKHFDYEVIGPRFRAFVQSVLERK